MKTTLVVLLIMEIYTLSSGLMKQHFFVKEEMTWNSANNYCKAYFHDLSTFTSGSEEQQFLEDAAHQPSDAWVGLYTESGIWKWTGGKNATQISSDINQQDNDNNCAFLHKLKKNLHGTNCNNSHAFFCMKVFKFVLVRQNETWEGALEYCRTHYNDLASLSTMRSINSALLSVTLAETEYVWTGLRYLAGHWFWVNGDNLDYTAWYQNEKPQCPARDLHCGALDKQTKFSHRNCEEKFNFVCQ